MYIDDLHKRLQIVKEDRKKAEMESKTIKNRVYLLQSQEKTVFQKFQRTKCQIDQIMQNRKYFQMEDKRTKVWREVNQKEANELKDRVKKMRLSRSAIPNKIKKDDIKVNKNKNVKSQTFEKEVIINLFNFFIITI